MSNLSELLPAGAGAKSADFVASGTLGSGVTVALQSDGTVTAVAETSDSSGSGVVFESASTNWMASTFDSSANKVVVAYTDVGNSSYGTAVVGTVSGTSISFGSAVVFNPASTEWIATTYDVASGKIVIAYRDVGNSYYGTAIVGTVSGTSISFGSEVVFYSTFFETISISYDSTASKVVIFGTDGNNNYGYGIVGTVSGTSISFGSAANFVSGSGSNVIASSYDEQANKTIVTYADLSNSQYPTTKVGTVSGTSISFGSAVIVNSGTATYYASVYDIANAKTVVFYRDAGNSNYGTANVGTVSGTSISFGAAVVFEAADSQRMTATYDSSNNKIVLAYSDYGNARYGTAVVGTVSGTSISFSTPVLYVNNRADSMSVTFDSIANKAVIAFQDASNSNHGTSVVFTVGSTNVTDFIGITDQAIADTATGAVIVQGGVSEKLSGLTVGADYYVQDDGSLESPTVSAPYVIDGASFVDSFSVSSQDSDVRGVAFNNNGTNMFVVGRSGDSVYEYTLSTGFDVSTASYSQNFSLAAQGTSPEDIAFNSDGTKMFIIDLSGDAVYEYTLSTAFDVSTASYSQNFSVAAQEITPTGLSFNTDGTKMFVVGADGDDVNEYALSTGFDVSTASYSQRFSVALQETSPSGIAFNADGTKMFVVGTAGDDVNEYTLSTGFDISTASYSQNFDVSSQDTSPTGIAFGNNGSKMFVIGDTNKSVYEYSTGVGSVTTAVPAGRALSSTSILLEG